MVDETGFSGDLTQEEIEEKLLADFAAAAGSGAQVTIPQATAVLLLQIAKDAGKIAEPAKKDAGE